MSTIERWKSMTSNAELAGAIVTGSDMMPVYVGPLPSSIVDGMARAANGVRRRSRGRPAGGSDALVRTILATTLAQLGARGYADLSIDEVARTARVNKTTIYRRWKTKPELVVAAVVASRERATPFVSSGDLATDLIALLRCKTRMMATPRQRAITHAVITLDRSVGPTLARELRGRRYALPREVVEQAIARGDLPHDTDAALVTELVLAPILYRALVLREAVPDELIVATVDVVLAGARSRKRR
jgi:AcrR family transcriptional regulator